MERAWGKALSFRYYIYISDSKVDMLLQQIDATFTRTRTSEFSLDLKFLGARRGTEVSPGADRTTRLERVVRHLEDHGDLGTVDEPGQFFWGMLPMQWRPVTSGAGSSLVYFGGRTERTILGLGGSRRHVLGSPPSVADDPVLSQSLMPSILDGLAGTSEIEAPSDVVGQGFDEAELAALRAVHHATAQLRGPAQNVEFIAKRLLCGPSPYPESDAGNDMVVLLGSPLYVALVD